MESPEFSAKPLFLALASLAVCLHCDLLWSSDAADRLETKDLLEATREAGMDAVWRVERGTWEAGAEVLRGAAAESSVAVVRMRSSLESSDFECEIRFRLLDKAKAFQIVVKPNGKPTDREGNLFSVVVARNAIKILRLRDRNLPGDFNRAVAEVSHSIEAGAWHDLTIRCVGGEVSLLSEGVELARASCQEFALEKGPLQLRVAGGSIEIGKLLVRVPAQD